jgi:hypothetical protein
VCASLERAIADRIPFGELAIDHDTVERILGHETRVRAKARCRIARLGSIDLVNLNARAFGPSPPRGERAAAPRQSGDIAVAHLGCLEGRARRFRAGIHDGMMPRRGNPDHGA